MSKSTIDKRYIMTPTRPTAEPVWRPRRQLPPQSIPSSLHHWMCHAGSLTRKLKSYCQHSFHVKIRAQGWGFPSFSERRSLGLAPRQFAIIREVELHCDGLPWVYARSIIPPTLMAGPGKPLNGLGSRPLGEVLFQDPNVSRGAFEHALIAPAHSVYQQAVQAVAKPPKRLWGRRSVFTLAGNPLLVAEIFLPNVPDFPEQPAVQPV